MQALMSVITARLPAQLPTECLQGITDTGLICSAAVIT
jgi:hypothetical protein